jgi:YVTN family beta-propeller protein
VNLYAATGPGDLAPAAARALPLVYVPNLRSGTVTVIDPATHRVLRTIPTGAMPQHVVPTYDLSRLWVLNNRAGTVTPIDPVTGQAEKPLPVPDPYNLYFTPDGRSAIVVAESERRLHFRDPRTLRLTGTVVLPCEGPNHMEFTASGRYALVTCEFSGEVVKLDLATRRVVGTLKLPPSASGGGAMPQDIRSSPDGRVFYVADMRADGVHRMDPDSLRLLGFVPTGTGAHGLVVSRDGRRLYVTNRGSHHTPAAPRGPGSVSVLDFASGRVSATWPVPGGGSPDMGNVTADGKELWVSGRYDDEVYAFDTATGRLAHRIPVGREPHGLCVWPQPGRVSLGHTGNMR